MGASGTTRNAGRKTSDPACGSSGLSHRFRMLDCINSTSLRLTVARLQKEAALDFLTSHQSLPNVVKGMRPLSFIPFLFFSFCFGNGSLSSKFL